MATPTITQEKLQIYQKFRGDIDGFARGGKPSEKRAIADEDWRFIDDALQSLVIVQAGLASPEFEASVQARLLAAAQNEEVFERLCQLAKSKF